jgi:hypothetical protein
MRRTLLGLAMAAVACSHDDSGVSPPGADDACTADGQTYCARRRDCWPEGISDFRFQRDYGTFAGCVEQRRNSCLADLERPGTGLSAARTQACALALDAQSCTDFLAGLPLPTSQCPPALGRLFNDAACVVTAQCQSGYCDRADDQLCGKCTDRHGPGGACDQNADCASGLVCTSGACAAPPATAALGQPCGAPAPDCQSALYCVGTTARTCQAALTTAGATCDPGHRTASDCDAAAYLWCNRTTLRCERRLLVDVGAACNELGDGAFAVCRAGASCVRNRDPATGNRPTIGKCVADVGTGMVCGATSSDGSGCLAGLRCVLDSIGAVVGTCRAQDAAMCR